MNALMIIAPYKYQGTWVFDDPAVGLSREPFISGIDTMIDKAVANIPNAEQGFRAIFSVGPFPGAHSDWNGDGKKRAEIGTTATNLKPKAGCVRLCCVTFRNRREKFTSRSIRKAEACRGARAQAKRTGCSGTPLSR
jgi:hypothetical protein